MLRVISDTICAHVYAGVFMIAFFVIVCAFS